MHRPHLFVPSFRSYFALLTAFLMAFEATAGLRWRWSNPAPHGNNIVDMACRNGLVVQVAERGQIYTSVDFDNWIPRDSHTTNALQAVTFFGNRIIVTGENGAALYSDDGVNFVYTNLNTLDWLVAVAASSSLVVAVGDEGAIYSSVNGAAWSSNATPASIGSKWLRGVAWGAGTFVTVGEGGYIATTTNAYGPSWAYHTNWTVRPITPSGLVPFTNDINRVIWIDTPNSPANGFPSPTFLAVADGGRAATSTNNGVTWKEIGALAGSNVLYTAAGNNSTRLLAGDLEVRLGSLVSNVVLWPRQVGSLPFTAPSWTYYSTLWETNGTNGFYLLAGQSGMIVEGSPNTNGVYAWQTPFVSPRDWLWDATTSLGLYVAVGDHARIMTSDNGIDWTTEAIPLTNSVSSTNTVFFGVGGTTNLLIAVGNKGSIALSPNNLYPVVITNSDGSTYTNQISSLGVIWYSMPAITNNNVTTNNDLKAVGVFGSQYLIAGGNGTLLSSLDGTNWTTRSVPTTNYLSSIETFPGGVVVVGDAGTILTSTDGLLWTKRTVTNVTAHTSGTTNWIFRVRYLQGTLLAVGENGSIYSSTNATAWTLVRSGTTAWLNDLQMVSNTCYIVGTQGTVLSSTNLAAWTNLGTITEKSLYAAANQNGQLVIVGIEGVILRSQVVPELSSVDFLDFSRADGVNVFSVTGQADQQFTLDSSADLVHWATGPLLELLYSSGTLLFIQNTCTNAPSPQFYRTTLVP